MWLRVAGWAVLALALPVLALTGFLAAATVGRRHDQNGDQP
jgi:hypothetical protein